jgi:hypothetical protein
MQFCRPLNRLRAVGRLSDDVQFRIRLEYHASLGPPLGNIVNDQDRCWGARAPSWFFQGYTCAYESLAHFCGVAKRQEAPSGDSR